MSFALVGNAFARSGWLNFSTTVENLFHLSFIVAEGHASLEKIDEDTILVNLATPSDKSAVASRQ